MQTDSRQRRGTRPLPTDVIPVDQLVQIDEDDEDSIDPIELFYVLLDKLKWIVLSALVAALLVGIYDFIFVKPSYKATSKLYVLNSKDSAISLSDLQIGAQLTSDYQEVFKNWPVHAEVIKRLGLDYSYEAIQKKISVTNPSNTRVLYITATANSPQEAKQLADTYAAVAQEFIASRMDTEQPSLFSASLMPVSPSSPNKSRDVIIGFLGGAILAMGIIVVMFLLDDRIRSSEVIVEKLGMPVLGMIPVQDRIGTTAKDKKKKKKGNGKA